MAFSDAVVVLADDLTIDTTSAGAVPAGADVTFSGPISADVAFLGVLTVEAGSGEVRLEGAVSELSTLAVFGGSIDLAGVSTFGSQAYFGPVRLGGDLITDGGGVELNGDVLLGSSVVVDTTNAGSSPVGADVTFSGFVDAETIGGQGLTVEAGDGVVVFGGDVGVLTDVSHFSAAGLLIDIGVVQAVGDIRLDIGVAIAFFGGDDSIRTTGGGELEFIQRVPRRYSIAISLTSLLTGFLGSRSAKGVGRLF